MSFMSPSPYAPAPAPMPTPPSPAPSASAGVGFAVTAVVLGILGCLFGLIPLFAPAAIGLGVIGVIFTVVAHIKRNRKGLKITGGAVSVVAVVLGAVGIVIVGSAVAQFDDDMKAISGGSAPAATSASASASADAEQTTFGGTVATESYTVQVSKPQAMTTSEMAAPKGGAKASKFMVTVTNKKSEPLDLTLASLTAARGGTESEKVFDSSKDVGGAPDTAIRSGKSATFPVAFLGEPTGEWTMDVRIGFGQKLLFGSN